MILNNNRGVTLLELLIALSLAVVILITLFSGMRVGYKSQASGSEKAELTQKIQIISDRIAWLIRGSYPFVLKQPDEQELYFNGESDRLGFVTTSIDEYGTGPEDTAGLKWVSIYKDDDVLKIREHVYFLEDVWEDSGGKEYTLLSDLDDISFEYFDIPEDETEGSWSSEWDTDEKNYLPSAIKVSLSFMHNGQTVVIPQILVHVNATSREFRK